MKRHPEILVLALSVLTVLGCRATEPPPVPLITDAGLAYAAAPTANTVRSVWLAKADVSGGVQVATGTQGSFRPSWSPDGESLAFFTQLSRDSTVIETIRGDGTGKKVPSARVISDAGARRRTIARAIEPRGTDWCRFRLSSSSAAPVERDDRLRAEAHEAQQKRQPPEPTVHVVDGRRE